MTSEAPAPERRIVCLPGARELADLAGVTLDLETALELTIQLERCLNTEPIDTALADALSTAIAIRYCRCFGTGVRKDLSADVVHNLPTELQQVHEQLRALRSQHIAHSVSAFEQNLVTVGLNDPADPSRPGTVDVLQRRWLAFDRLTLNAVRRLVESLLAEANILLKSGKDALQAQIDDLTPAEIAGWPSPPALDPSWRHISKRRKPKP